MDNKTIYTVGFSVVLFLAILFMFGTLLQPKSRINIDRGITDQYIKDYGIVDYSR